MSQRCLTFPPRHSILGKSSASNRWRGQNPVEAGATSLASAPKGSWEPCQLTPTHNDIHAEAKASSGTLSVQANGRGLNGTAIRNQSNRGSAHPATTSPLSLDDASCPRQSLCRDKGLGQACTEQHAYAIRLARTQRTRQLLEYGAVWVFHALRTNYEV